MKIARAPLAFLAVLGMSLPEAAFARDLTIAAWGGPYQVAQRKFIFDPFTEKTGIKVVEDTWNGGYGVIEAKMKAGDPNWDVVQVEADELELGCADGNYEKLDWSRLGNKEDWNESAVSECGVGAIVWAALLAYNPEKLSTGPKSWAEFWDTEKFPGKRGMRKNPKITLEQALLADGVAREDVYKVLSTPAGVDRAFAKLDAIKPHVVWFESGAQMQQILTSGEVALISGYDGRINEINKKEGTDYRVVWRDAIYNTDYLVILKGARNKEAGMDLIAFASQPEVLSKTVSEVFYGLPNKKAAAMVPTETAKLLPAADNLVEAMPINARFWLDNSEALNQRFTAWLSR